MRIVLSPGPDRQAVNQGCVMGCLTPTSSCAPCFAPTPPPQQTSRQPKFTTRYWSRQKNTSRHWPKHKISHLDIGRKPKKHNTRLVEKAKKHISTLVEKSNKHISILVKKSSEIALRPICYLAIPSDHISVDYPPAAGPF